MVLMVSLRIHVLKDKTLVDGFHLNVPDSGWEQCVTRGASPRRLWGDGAPLSTHPQIPFPAFRMNHAGISTSNLLMIHTVQPLPDGQKGPFVRNRSSVRNNLILDKQNLTITIVCNSG